MQRRNFLKGLLAVSLLAPIARLTAKSSKSADKKSENSLEPVKISSRTINGITVPLLGFGTMRLPRKTKGEPAIDYDETRKLFARAIECGVNYFDTAYFYHRGLSEVCVGDLLSSYPRESYFIADKMPIRMLKTEADLERIWQEQLKRCKTKYFDFYLLHALNKRNWVMTSASVAHTEKSDFVSCLNPFVCHSANAEFIVVLMRSDCKYFHFFALP